MKRAKNACETGTPCLGTGKSLVARPHAPTGDYGPFWDLPPYMSQGSAHSVSSEPGDTDIVDQLYDAVEEATGKDMRPAKRGIGFV